jgi:hypothetical protein
VFSTRPERPAQQTGLRSRLPLCCLIAFLGASSCAPVISPFSRQAYLYATELKVDALKVMDRAELSFGENEDRVEKLKTDLEKAYEFARGRPNNAHSTRQWEILIDPNSNLLGGFLKRWEAEGRLSYAFITESKRLVSAAFDAVIGLESGKTRPDEL